MIIHVTDVRVVGPHSLALTFNDDVQKRVNLRRELYGPVFEPLRDPAYFQQAALDPQTRTVTRPNGADFAPDFLHQPEAEASPAEAAQV